MDEICADLRAETDDLRNFLVGLTDDEWLTPTPAEGWDIRDTISHLAYFDHQAVLALRDPDGFAEHLSTIVGNDDLMAFVDGQVAQSRHMSGSEVLAWWDRERSALLEEYAGVEPSRRVQWYGPAMAARSKVTARLMETWAHGQDVVDGLGCKRVVTDRIRHVCHIGVRARPFGFMNNNLPVPDEEVQVVLTGPTGDVWTWGDPDSGERVEGPAVDFALLTCQRRHRDDLAVTATGRVADQWLSIAQAFAGSPGSRARRRTVQLMARHCYVLRVFTRDGVGGNHLGVVTDMSGLGEDDLQDIATELGYSETIYLDWRNRDMPKVRIFTPGAELPFAGHPLVGMTWVLNRLGPGGTGEIECGIGRVRSRMDGDAAWIDAPLDQPVTLDAALPATCGPGLAAVGVVPEHVAMVEMPIPYHVVELADSDAVRAVVTPQEGMVSFYSWVDDSTVHTRFFAPGHGIAEDPATGSAAVALAASLRARGRAEGAITLLQGEEMGFPSQIELRWSNAGVSIGGRVVKDEVLWLER